jgi:hypothetical protein
MSPLAVLFAAALVAMCLIRLPAGILLKVRGRRLASLLLCPFGYLIFAVAVALVLAWLVQRTAFIKADTVFWDGDNERAVFGISMKHVLLFILTVLPITFFDRLLVKRIGRETPNTSVWKTLDIRSLLGWMGLVAANCLLPLAIVVAGNLIREILYAGY